MSINNGSAQTNSETNTNIIHPKLNELRLGGAVSNGAELSISYERFLIGEASIGARGRFLASKTIDEEIGFIEDLNLSFVARYYSHDIFKEPKTFVFYLEGTFGYAKILEKETVRQTNSQGNLIIKRDLVSSDNSVASIGLGLKAFIGKKLTIETGFGLGGYFKEIDSDVGYGFLNLELGYRF